MYSLTSSSLISTSSKSAIFNRQATSGWEVLVHHLLTVDGFTPNCSANHLLVRFFSTRTNLILFTSSMLIGVLCHKDSDLLSFIATERHFSAENYFFLRVHAPKSVVLDFKIESCQ